LSSRKPVPKKGFRGFYTYQAVRIIVKKAGEICRGQRAWGGKIADFGLRIADLKMHRV
jgi:hypothetical protein